eukprot:SAG22_NODE_1584_length_4060_cov_81.610452_7_plen_64_part_00
MVPCLVASRAAQMIWIGTFYGMVNDPEAAHVDTGAEQQGSISHPFVVTSIEMGLLIIMCVLQL